MERKLDASIFLAGSDAGTPGNSARENFSTEDF
jgi:hypothetical protein